MTQTLYASWGSAQSEAIGLRNGIRQGSIISPYLLNVCVDELNLLLTESKLDCHTGGEPINSFFSADDLAIAAATAKTLNVMLIICADFH